MVFADWLATRTSSGIEANRRSLEIVIDFAVKQGLIPKNLATAVVRPEQFAFNQQLLQLSVAGERLWDDAWSKFKAG